MSVPRSVSEVLADHVSLEVEGIDRMYLNVYVPQLQRDTGVVGFFHYHRGHQFVSSALMDPISKRFIAAMEAFANEEQIPVVQFRKGQRKDDVAAEHLSRFEETEGVLFIGKAQEKTPHQKSAPGRPRGLAPRLPAASSHKRHARARFAAARPDSKPSNRSQF
jgi:hypothetical protein